MCTLEAHADQQLNVYDKHFGDEILIPARRSGGELFCETVMGALEKRLTNEEVRDSTGVVHFLHQRQLSVGLRGIRYI